MKHVTHHLLDDADKLDVTTFELSNLVIDARHVFLVNFIQRLERVTGVLQSNADTSDIISHHMTTV